MEPARARVSLEADGFEIVEGVLTSATIEHLIEALREVTEIREAERRIGVYAVRNLLEVVPECASLAEWPGVRNLAGPSHRPVRAIFFDKISGANWKVPWHQDLTISVRERRDVPGFGPWSVKEGALHVQAPTGILERMVAVRLHLDDCPDTNGALRVLPGTHKLGRLPAAEVTRIAAGQTGLACSVNAGDAVLMRPLLLHASSPSQTVEHRRVIHIEYAGIELPGGLEWA